MKHGMHEILRENWIHPDEVEGWYQSMAKGRTLNVCCGTSMVGDVRVDISEKATGRTMVGDMDALTFPDHSFDTVICDPPFSVYNKWTWIVRLAGIAKSRVILSSPNIHVRLGKTWKSRLFLHVGHMFVRFIWVFDRQDGYAIELGPPR